MKSITAGIDAIGAVTVRVKKDEMVYVGRGSDTDVIVASAKAYITALNRMLSMEGAQKEVARGPNP